VTFKFPKKLPKEWIEAIERNGRVGSVVHDMKVAAKDKRGTIVHLGGDVFKILHNGKNQDVFGNPLVGKELDPYFGYSERGGSRLTGWGYILGSWFTCPSEGTADSITVYLGGTLSKGKCGIYRKSDGSFVGETEEKTSIPEGWNTFNFTDPKPSLSNVDYWLVVFGEAAPSVFATSETGKMGRTLEDMYPNFPDPWTPEIKDYKISIYCTYTPVGPPPEYSLTISATVGGTTDPAPGSYKHPYDTTVTVTAIPDSDYYFNHWVLDGVDAGKDNPINVLMDRDHTLEAVFGLVTPPAKAVIYDITFPESAAPGVTFKATVWIHNAGDEAGNFRITWYLHWSGARGESDVFPWDPCTKAGISTPYITMPSEDATITFQSQHLEGETWITDDERTVTVKPGNPYATVEEAYTPTETEPNQWQPWSVKVHNTGGYGYIGAAVFNRPDSPGLVKLRWMGQEWELPPGEWSYIYYTYPLETCETGEPVEGSILYPAGGKYIIWLCGVHGEGPGDPPPDWFIDDHREFLVTAGPPTHILTVESSPISGVPFTLDGLSLVTPFSSSMDEATYTVTMPESVTINGVDYNFLGWADGVTTPTRVIELTTDTALTANYEAVAAPEYTLAINSSPTTGIPVTVDDASVGVTPVSVTVVEGDHTISVPEEVEV